MPEVPQFASLNRRNQRLLDMRKERSEPFGTTTPDAVRCHRPEQKVRVYSETWTVGRLGLDTMERCLSSWGPRRFRRFSLYL